MSKEIRVTTIEVEDCVGCPHRSVSSWGAPASFYYCVYPGIGVDARDAVKGKKILGFRGIPVWCPLPIKEYKNPYENPDEPDPKLVSYFPSNNPKEIRKFNKAVGIE